MMSEEPLISPDASRRLGRRFKTQAEWTVSSLEELGVSLSDEE